jgi:hypothetical protein
VEFSTSKIVSQSIESRTIYKKRNIEIRTQYWDRECA